MLFVLLELWIYVSLLWFPMEGIIVDNQNIVWYLVDEFYWNNHVLDILEWEGSQLMFSFEFNISSLI